jgi:hypothetical protein
VRPALLDLPVIVGNTKLYRPSWMAMEWLSDCAEKWFADNPKLMAMSAAWALAHSRDPDAFKAADNYRAAARNIKRWARRCDCSLAALVETVNSLMPEPQKRTGPEPNKSMLLMRLMQEFGQDEYYWLCSGPVEKVRAAFDLLEAQSMAAQNSVKGNAQARNPDHWEQQAFWRWRNAALAFRDKYMPGKKT